MTAAQKPTLPGCITIHCSASKNGVPWPAEEIRKFHVEQRGWSDIGYHMVIQPDGSVERGRALNTIGAHVEGHNAEQGLVNVGICLIGTDRFTPAQFVSLRYKLDGLFMAFNIPKWAIYCHHDFDTARAQGKTCPNILGQHLMHWYLTQDDAAIRSYLL